MFCRNLQLDFMSKSRVTRANTDIHRFLSDVISRSVKWQHSLVSVSSCRLNRMVSCVEAESGGEKNGVPARPESPVSPSYLQTAPLPNGASWQSCRKLIIVPRSAQKGYTVGHWPIPESFWPDINNDSLVRVKLCYSKAV